MTFAVTWLVACADTVPESLRQVITYTFWLEIVSTELPFTSRFTSATRSLLLCPGHAAPFLVIEQLSTLVASQPMVELLPACTRAGVAVMDTAGTRTVTAVWAVYEDPAGQVIEYVSVVPEVGGGGVTVYVPLVPLTLWPSENWQELAHADGTDQPRAVCCPRSTVAGFGVRSTGTQEFTVTEDGEQIAVAEFPFDVTCTLAVLLPTAVYVLEIDVALPERLSAPLPLPLQRYE